MPKTINLWFLLSLKLKNKSLFSKKIENLSSLCKYIQFSNKLKSNVYRTTSISTSPGPNFGENRTAILQNHYACEWRIEWGLRKYRTTCLSSNRSDPAFYKKWKFLII